MGIEMSSPFTSSFDLIREITVVKPSLNEVLVDKTTSGIRMALPDWRCGNLAEYQI
jgi:hypothetical protein